MTYGVFGLGNSRG